MLMTCRGLLQLPCFSDIAKGSLIALPSHIFRYLVLRFWYSGILYFVFCILYFVLCTSFEGVWGVRNEIGLILISSPFLVSTFNLCDFNAVVPSELSIFFSPPLQFIEFSLFEPLNFFQEWPSGNTMEPMLAGIVVLLIVLDPFFFFSADKKVPTREVSWGVPSRSGWSENIKT